MTISLLTSSPTHTLNTSSISANLAGKVTTNTITYNLSLKPVSIIPYIRIHHFKKHYNSIKVKSSENGNSSVVVSEEKVVELESSNSKNEKVKMEKSEDSVGPTSEDIKVTFNGVKKFSDVRWINGTWDVQQFNVNGTTNWDALIDAEAKRRKWLQTYPESTSNDEPIIFDTSIIPWWAWIKRFHLPEAELLNGRAAMVGFFMSYFVDSLTGVGLVDQMGNFFCKILLFISVLGVLFIRKNEDIENLKKLLDESTFYDKQWQATWQEGTKKD